MSGNTNTNITTIEIQTLSSVFGGGAGECDFAPPAYGSPAEGAGAVARAVYLDTTQGASTQQLRDAEHQLKSGADWNDVCAKTRSAVAPHYKP